MICSATDSVSVITRMDATHLMTSFSWAGMRRLELAVSSPVTSVTTELFSTEEGGACDTVALDNQHMPNIHFGFGLCLKSTAMVILFIKIKRSFSMHCRCSTVRTI